MAKLKPSKLDDQNPGTQHSFEESLDELQQIVDELEEGNLGLEESMRRFETGIALLRGCYRVLEEAEQKIEILTGTDAEGNPLTEPFDATATIKQPAGTPAGRRSRTKKGAQGLPSGKDDSRKRLF